MTQEEETLGLLLNLKKGQLEQTELQLCQQTIGLRNALTKVDQLTEQLKTADEEVKRLRSYVDRTKSSETEDGPKS